MNATDMHRIIRNHYRQLYTNKSEDVLETERILNTNNLQKLNQEVITKPKSTYIQDEDLISN